MARASNVSVWLVPTGVTLPTWNHRYVFVVVPPDPVTVNEAVSPWLRVCAKGWVAIVNGVTAATVG